MNTREEILKELRIAMKSQSEMEQEYECDMTNHVSCIVECILENNPEEKEE